MSLFNPQIITKRKKFVPGNKVYLSLSSEGLGHSSRGLAIAREFQKDEIVMGTYNYALKRLTDNGYNCVALPQELELIGTKGSFDVRKTIIKNHTWALTFNNIINEEMEAIRQHNAGCVVADGRLTPVMAADRLGLPCIVITNQSAFYPFFEKDTALIRVFGKSFDWIMKTWLSSAEEILIPDFPPPHTISIYNLSKNFRVMKRTRFVGPLVSFDTDELKAAERPADKYIVVALGGHAYRRPLLDTIIEAARQLKDYYFDVFANFDVPNLPDNVIVHQSVPTILHYLKAADIVITQGGHSTAMELMTLGKPSIIIPDYKQIEQENNALRMHELKTSIRIEKPDFTPERVIETIKMIMSDSVYLEKAQYYSRLAREIQGRKRAATVIKEYAGRLQRY